MPASAAISQSGASGRATMSSDARRPPSRLVNGRNRPPSPLRRSTADNLRLSGGSPPRLPGEHRTIASYKSCAVITAGPMGRHPVAICNQRSTVGHRSSFSLSGNHRLFSRGFITSHQPNRAKRRRPRPERRSTPRARYRFDRIPGSGKSTTSGLLTPSPADVSLGPDDRHVYRLPGTMVGGSRHPPAQRRKIRS
jgi:hypothetical protein